MHNWAKKCGLERDRKSSKIKEYMSSFDLYNTFVSAVVFPVMVGSFIYIGRKLQVLDILVKDVDILKHNSKVVSDFLTKNFSDFIPSELKANSPYQLTEGGKKFISKIGFDTVFSENKKDFFDCIEVNSPKLKYDVESGAIQLVYFLSEKSYMDFLKVYFYNHPERNMQNTAPTLGVYIRDNYLAEHPEIIQ